MESSAEPTPQQQQQLLSFLLSHLSQAQQHSLSFSAPLETGDCSSIRRDPFYSISPACCPDPFTFTNATSSSGATDYEASSLPNAQLVADRSLSNVSADDQDALHGPLSTSSLNDAHEEEDELEEDEDEGEGHHKCGSEGNDRTAGASGGGAGAGATKSGTAAASVVSRKSRRRRTAFSAAQLQSLERQFGHHKYLSVADRAEIAQRLRLSETQIKIWYQNRRCALACAQLLHLPCACTLL